MVLCLDKHHILLQQISERFGKKPEVSHKFAVVTGQAEEAA
jgi:hypothetical protein